MDNPPICPLCGIRERMYDSEPPLSGGERDYFSHCYECSSLIRYRDHTHTFYGSPEQVAAGSVKAGHSWRTLITLHPIMVDGEPVGYRCTEFDRCGWEIFFTPEEMELCTVDHRTHNNIPIPRRIKALCRDSWDHRVERGEISLPHGYITDHGRTVEQERADANTWDPGKYVPYIPR